MASSALKESEDDLTFGPEQLGDRFIPFEGEDALQDETFEDRYDHWFHPNLRRFLGVDIHGGAVFRPKPISDQQIRTAPSTTGKVVEWEGVVEAVREDEFECRLRVVKGSDVDFDEFTTFALGRVDQDDLDLVVPGALFRLVIGMQALAGTRQQFSRLVFRRLPAWNQHSIDEAHARLRNLVEGINWSDEGSTSG